MNVLVEGGRLAAEGRPFALATVVTVERPASARRGDHAIVTEDGALTGWVGGACTEATVVRESLAALADGEARLVRVAGGCASEGAIELLIEPQLPAPLLAVIGDSPAARMLAELARTLGWRVEVELAERANAVVVASMGQVDEDALEAALATDAGYVGLVASAKRGSAVLAELRERGLDEEALARVRCPAGLDLGPSSQEEIAVAILAELVAWRHTRPGSAAELVEAAEAVDPVCGMTVATATATETAVWEGTTYYFCGAGCRNRFERDPESHLGAPR
ncbi:MAG TPA: XdhC family protein [Gaiellaceae bacterium]|nr:XdhC family protein [Gaiellaceae bacterium]